MLFRSTSGGLPTWGPLQGRHTNIHPFVSPAKVVKKIEAPHINKDKMPLSVLMLFFTEIVHLLVEQINVCYQQHLDVQARPSHQLPDITLPDIMTFIALALQTGHELRHTTRLLVETQTATHTVLRRDHDKRQIFTHTVFSKF